MRISTVKECYWESFRRNVMVSKGLNNAIGNDFNQMSLASKRSKKAVTPDLRWTKQSGCGHLTVA